jgi:hypothetical protein
MGRIASSVLLSPYDLNIAKIGDDGETWEVIFFKHFQYRCRNPDKDVLRFELSVESNAKSVGEPRDRCWKTGRC